MNKQEAKFILQAYRPGGEDAANPQFAEALEVARQTPELTQWLSEETALDEALGRKLQDTPVPEDLKEKILVSRKLIQVTPRWRQPAWLAAAASVALMLGLLVSLQSPAKPGQEFTDYRQSMIEFAQHRMDGLDYKSETIPDIRQWLANRQSRRAARQGLPPAAMERPASCPDLFQHRRRAGSPLRARLQRNAGRPAKRTTRCTDTGRLANNRLEPRRQGLSGGKPGQQ